jgi:hypothetical protein
MRRITTLLGAGALVLGPALGIATPSLSQPASGSISPNHDTGQQVGGEDGLECEDAGAAARPGTISGQEPGPGNPFQEDSISGAHYAGEQAGINDKNTAAVSQYDLACFTHNTPE